MTYDLAMRDAVEAFDGAIRALPLPKDRPPQPQGNVRLPAGTTIVSVDSHWTIHEDIFYENFPVVVLEAWSVGTPVVVPDHGAFPSLVSHLEDGLLFSSGDAVALAQVLRTALSSSEHEWPRWSINARKKYITDYTELRNYQQLISIYQKAIHRSSHHLRTQTHRSPVVSSALGAQAQDLES